MANMSTKRLLLNMSLFHVNENSVLLTRVLLHVKNSGEFKHEVQRC